VRDGSGQTSKRERCHRQGLLAGLGSLVHRRAWYITCFEQRPTGELGYIIMNALRTSCSWIAGFFCFVSISIASASSEPSPSALLPCEALTDCRNMLITARRYEKKQQNHSALQLYVSAYKEYLDPRIYFYIGRIQSKQKKYKEAMDSLLVYIDSHLDEKTCSLMKNARALHSDAARRERRSARAVQPIQPVQSVQTARAVQPVQTVQAARAVQSVQTARAVRSVVAVGRFSEQFRVARRPRWLGPHPRDGEGAGK
jgi:hypothetical protein